MLRFRRLVAVILVAALVCLTAGTLWAAGPAGNAAAGPPAFHRDPGGYLSWIKILCCWLVFLAWVGSTDWVSRDAVELKLDYRRWNAIVFGSFLGTFVLLWLIPLFWLVFPLLLIAYAVPLTLYVLDRNVRVGEHMRVLTRGHLRYLLAEVVGKFGVRMAAESRDPNEEGSPVKVFARGGADAPADAARMLAARQSPGLPQAREILYEGLAGRATAIMLDFTPSAVTVRHMVDGVWMPREPRERETADPALESLKLLCGANPQDRQNRQEGKFGIEYVVIRQLVFDKIDKARAAFQESTIIEVTRRLATEELTPAQLQQQVSVEVAERVRDKFATSIGPWSPVHRDRLPKMVGVEALNPTGSVEPVRTLATFASQGIQGGERVLIQFEIKAQRLASLDDLGMRAKMQEQVKELLGRERGFVLLSALPGAGLRTATNVVLRSQDRFTREFAAVEEATNRYDEVENVPVTTYKAADGETPVTVLPKLFREQPNVVVVRDLVDAATVGMLCKDIAGEGRLVIGTIRAKDCAEALLRVLALGVPPQDFARQVTMVLGQRLIRKLCERCKEAYAPAPQVLQQLGIPEGRLRALYRPPQPKPDDDKKDMCPECGGTGYKGQTGLFELLVVDDTLRKALAAKPKLDVLRQVARKAGQKSLREEGILLVARGATSLPELMRVLKQ
jgi:type II secretory ATPase GspE/PulE/Tfp pilus assembly ATPase PilB-like protein